MDWSQAPEGATHYKDRLFYRQYLGVWEYHNDYAWFKSSNTDGWFKDAVSKEEDLEMNKEVKVVRSVDDLEVGMFIRWNSYMDYCYVVSKPKQIISFNTGGVFNCGEGGCWADDNFYTSSWSYIYNGEYTPIVKDTVETEAERKIKELEATIELAQKQLQEYKEMK